MKTFLIEQDQELNLGHLENNVQIRQETWANKSGKLEF